MAKRTKNQEPPKRTIKKRAIDAAFKPLDAGFSKYDALSDKGKKRVRKARVGAVAAATLFTGIGIAETSGLTNLTGSERAPAEYSLESTDVGYRSKPNTEKTDVNSMQVLGNHASWGTLKPEDQKTLDESGHVAVSVEYDLDAENGGGTETKQFDVTRMTPEIFERIGVVDAGSNSNIQFMASSTYQEVVPGKSGDGLDSKNGQVFVGSTYGRSVPDTVAFTAIGQEGGDVLVVTEPTTPMFVFEAPAPSPHGSISPDGSTYSPAPSPGGPTSIPG